MVVCTSRWMASAKLHGNHRWTMVTGQQMKGTSMFIEAEDGGRWSGTSSSESDGSMSHGDWEREEQRQIHLTIASSLEDGDAPLDLDVPPADPERALVVNRALG